MGYPMSPSSASPPPPRRGWWSRPIVTLPAQHDRRATCKEFTVSLTPCCGGIFTVIAVMVFLSFLDNPYCVAKISIQSIAVSPSSATWHVDFLVKNPSSRCSIFYGGDETTMTLGPLNAAVLNTSHARKSPSHTAFSVDFVAERNSTDVVFEQLHMKLRANHKGYGVDSPEPGHIDIRCYNLSRNHKNFEKVQCYSSFTRLKEVI